MTIAQLTYPFFVLIGPSGSGKTNVAEAVFPKEAKVISHTTRPKRPSEQAGVDYYFDSQEQFASLIQSNAFAEYDCYNGYYYGVSIEELLGKTANQAAFDVLTYQGYKQITTKFNGMIVPIFLDVSKENVQKRLNARGEHPDKIQERLALYEKDTQTKKKLIHQQQAFIIDANQSFEQVVIQVEDRVAQKIAQWQNQNA